MAYGGWHQKFCTRQACQDAQSRVQDFWCQPPYILRICGTVMRRAIGLVWPGATRLLISVDPTRIIYSKCLNNCELLLVFKCINGARHKIPPFLIVTETNILAPWFANDLDPNVDVLISETGFNNNWILLQWIKHFERFSQSGQRGSRRLLIMDGYGSHICKPGRKLRKFKLRIPPRWPLASPLLCWPAFFM